MLKAYDSWKLGDPHANHMTDAEVVTSNLEDENKALRELVDQIYKASMGDSAEACSVVQALVENYGGEI